MPATFSSWKKPIGAAAERAGWDIVYQPQIWITHAGQHSMRQAPARNLPHLYRSYTRFYRNGRQHTGGRGRVLLLKLIFALAILVRLGLWSPRWLAQSGPAIAGPPDAAWLRPGAAPAARLLIPMIPTIPTIPTIPPYRSLHLESGGMTISVIVPAHNAAGYLRHSLPAWQRSTYPAFECIVMDDASTDDTAAVCQAFVVQRVGLTGAAHGPATARNRLRGRQPGRHFALSGRRCGHATGDPVTPGRCVSERNDGRGHLRLLR